MQNFFWTSAAIRCGAILFLISATMSCQTANSQSVKLLTLDPGHFHAALVQKSMYPDVDSIVHVYAPAGEDLQLHLDRIKAYNSREKDPTHWAEQVYTGKDFFDKMIADKAGNTVVLSGNNREKTDYILGSLKAGLNVLADKPMVIDAVGFELLRQAFDTAEHNHLLLYDIMTERYEITAMLQREFSGCPDIFGTQEKGDPAHPGVVMTSVHHFYKQVSGKALIRPPWFFDVKQQGEGIVDVMTHLVDLVQWECFPEQALDYKKDIRVDAARHWPMEMDGPSFKEITGMDSVPSYLMPMMHGNTGSLRLYVNGEIGYRLRGIHVRTTATWTYKDPLTAEDSYYSLLRGTKANLVIRQGAEEKFKPILYIEPISATAAGLTAYEKDLLKELEDLQKKYPGIGLERTGKGWMVTIPENYNEGHEAHFARVTQHFLGYLKDHNIPAWERPNMIAKYYTTTRALEIARQHH
jgi:predicted dehydrogenase